jgi:hypothetical protein
LTLANHGPSLELGWFSPTGTSGLLLRRHRTTIITLLKC